MKTPGFREARIGGDCHRLLVASGLIPSARKPNNRWRSSIRALESEVVDAAWERSSR